jgi:glycosyltransferase involved in cell wall biosynthesis
LILIENNDRPKRVLQMSFAFSPYAGSEPGTGWNRAVQSAKAHETWVVACDTPRVDGPLEEAIDVPGLNIVHIPRTRLEQILGRVSCTKFLAYNLWQRRVMPKVAALHQQYQFDLIHHSTYASFREPGYTWKLDAPFVWGPVGGTQNFPWRFLCKAGLKGGLSELARNLINNFQLYTSRRFRKAGRKAAVIIAANSTAQRDFTNHLGRESVLLSDIGCTEIVRKPRKEPDETLRILWSGVITSRKALYLLIEALSLLPHDVKYELHVLGEGPDQRRSDRLARRLGVDANVQWLGRLSHAEAKRRFLWADIFVFTSLRDTTGTVLCESLSHGTPVICFDHQGAHDIVTEACGIKIPVGKPEDSIRRLSQAIASLARDRETLRAKGEAAIDRARNYLWDELGDKMRVVYEDVWQQQQQQQPTASNAGDSNTLPMPKSPDRETAAVG